REVIPQGWQCPACRRILAPSIAACHCQTNGSSEEPHAILDSTPLANLPLSTRVRSVLTYRGIKTVGEARGAEDERLMQLPNFGRISVKELRDLIGPYRVENEAQYEAAVQRQEAVEEARLEIGRGS